MKKHGCDLAHVVDLSGCDGDREISRASSCGSSSTSQLIAAGVVLDEAILDASTR
jgi:hypothetical protein